MRSLVIGAGAIGGYFGGRLLQAGQNVTFLVRQKRANEVASAGLVIKSPLGDVTLKNPPTVQAEELTEAFDVILLSCKAFDLEGAIASFAPAVGPNTAIIPLLNGMRHLGLLEKKFGASAVLGGQCQIAATLNDKREVVHLAPMQSLSYGERNGLATPRLRAISEVMKSGNFGAVASNTIIQDMWEKWIVLATIAGVTSSMRGEVGDIVSSPGGRDLMLGVRDEIAAVATVSGYPPRAGFLERSQGMLIAEKSRMTASMYRDILINAATEADQIIGDLIDRANSTDVSVPRLRMIYTHLKTYERQRQYPLRKRANEGDSRAAP